jgi:Glycosyl transferase family 2
VVAFPRSEPQPGAGRHHRRTARAHRRDDLLRVDAWCLFVMTDVDVVVPVHNEQAALERSIRNLHRYLRTQLPFSWRIVIADNASTDATPAVAAADPTGVGPWGHEADPKRRPKLTIAAPRGGR